MKALFLFLCLSRVLGENAAFPIHRHHHHNRDNRPQAPSPNNSNNFVGVTRGASPNQPTGQRPSPPSLSPQGYTPVVTTAKPLTAPNNNKAPENPALHGTGAGGLTGMVQHNSVPSVSPKHEAEQNINMTADEAQVLEHLEDLKLRVQKLEAENTAQDTAIKAQVTENRKQEFAIKKADALNKKQELSLNAPPPPPNASQPLAKPGAAGAPGAPGAAPGAGTTAAPVSVPANQTVATANGPAPKIFDGVGSDGIPHPGQIIGVTTFGVAEPLVGIGAPDPDNKRKYNSIDVGKALNTDHGAVVKGRAEAEQADQEHKDFLDENTEEFERVMAWLQQSQQLLPGNRQPPKLLLHMLKERIIRQEQKIIAQMSEQDKAKFRQKIDAIQKTVIA